MSLALSERSVVQFSTFLQIDVLNIMLKDGFLELNVMKTNIFLGNGKEICRKVCSDRSEGDRDA